MELSQGPRATGFAKWGMGPLEDKVRDVPAFESRRIKVQASHCHPFAGVILNEGGGLSLRIRRVFKCSVVLSNRVTCNQGHKPKGGMGRDSYFLTQYRQAYPQRRETSRGGGSQSQENYASVPVNFAALHYMPTFLAFVAQEEILHRGLLKCSDE